MKIFTHCQWVKSSIKPIIHISYQNRITSGTPSRNEWKNGCGKEIGTKKKGRVKLMITASKLSAFKRQDIPIGWRRASSSPERASSSPLLSGTVPLWPKFCLCRSISVTFSTSRPTRILQEQKEIGEWPWELVNLKDIHKPIIELSALNRWCLLKSGSRKNLSISMRTISESGNRALPASDRSWKRRNWDPYLPAMRNWRGCLNTSMRTMFPASSPTTVLQKCPDGMRTSKRSWRRKSG